MGVTIGQTVHYIAYHKAHLAAIIIGVDGPYVDLVVFTSLENVNGVKNFGMQFHQNIVQGNEEQPGTYQVI